MIEGNKYAVVMMKHGDRHFKISSNVGETIPLPWTASGRLLLSHLAADEIQDMIPEEDFVLPNGNLLSTETPSLQRSGDPGRADSVPAIPRSTAILTVFAASVINERRECIATLCLVVPREEAYRRYDTLKEALVEEARALSNSLGGRDPVDSPSGSRMTTATTPEKAAQGTRYRTAGTTGTGRQLRASGHPRRSGLLFRTGPADGRRRPSPRGKVGAEVTAEEAYAHARRTGIVLLAAMKKALGSLDRVERVVKIFGMVNATPEFAGHPAVINGCSDLMVEVFGEAGRHARSARSAWARCPAALRSRSRP